MAPVVLLCGGAGDIKNSKLNRAEVGVVHVVDDAGDGLLVVLLGLGRPPPLIGRLKVGLGVYDLVPLLAVVADARDHDDGRPRVLVAA